MSVASILSGPLGLALGGIKDLFLKKLGNDSDKIEALAAVDRYQAELEKAVIDADVKFAEARQAVLVAEASSESWLTSSWRPLLMLFFGLVIGWVVFHGAYDLYQRPIPEEYVKYIFKIVEIGVTGYVVGRSAEKVLPGIATAVTAAFKKGP